MSVTPIGGLAPSYAPISGPSETMFFAAVKVNQAQTQNFFNAEAASQAKERAYFSVVESDWAHELAYLAVAAASQKQEAAYLLAAGINARGGYATAPPVLMDAML